jgi:subtilisin
VRQTKSFEDIPAEAIRTLDPQKGRLLRSCSTLDGRGAGLDMTVPSRPVRSIRLVAVLCLFLFSAVPIARSAPSPTKRYIVVLKNRVVDPGAVARRQVASVGGTLSHVYRYALKGYSAVIPVDRLAALEAQPDVDFVSEDGDVQAASTCPLDTSSGFPAQCIPPGVDRIDADQSSAVSGDGSGSVNVNVAVIDSGIDPSHPDLNVAGGYNCTAGPTSKWADEFGHGTWVAGIIGARDNAFGVVGVAPGANLWSVRVLNKQGTGSASSVLCGIDWVTSTRMDADPTNDIVVANASIVGSGRDDGNCGNTPKRDAFHQAICNSTAAGVTYVVAAGNESTDFQNTRPAAYDEVLTVTAMGDFDGQPGSRYPNACAANGDDQFARFSNFATLGSDRAHTIAAPGVCVVTTTRVGTFPTTNYQSSLLGTSFASPHAAGAVALCIAYGGCTGLTPEQIIAKFVSDSAAYTTAHPDYGFFGDPIDPIPGKFYGYLLHAGEY